ncbi:MAG: hypothetical protein KAR44_04665 [Candidatus Aegiribacteria sp.]|nr:hypothetical protein [Candidatus Aegiribacteria sp.]
MSDESIRNAFAFSIEDLQANENGLLTEKQEDLLHNYSISYGCGTRAAFIAIGLTLVIMSVVLLLVAEPGSAGFRQAMPYFAGTGAVFLLIFVFFLYLGKVRSRDLHSGSISTLEGEIRTWTKEFPTGTSFYMELGGTRFQLHTSEQMDALSTCSFYRIYYIRNPPTHVILSLRVIV